MRNQIRLMKPKEIRNNRNNDTHACFFNIKDKYRRCITVPQIRNKCHIFLISIPIFGLENSLVSTQAGTTGIRTMTS